MRKHLPEAEHIELTKDSKSKRPRIIKDMTYDGPVKSPHPYLEAKIEGFMVKVDVTNDIKNGPEANIPDVNDIISVRIDKAPNPKGNGARGTYIPSYRS